MVLDYSQLISRSIVFLRSIYVVAGGGVYLVLSESPLHHAFFTQASTEDHFGCLHILVIVNIAAVNKEVHTPL